MYVYVKLYQHRYRFLFASFLLSVACSYTMLSIRGRWVASRHKRGLVPGAVYIIIIYRIVCAEEPTCESVILASKV